MLKKLTALTGFAAGYVLGAKAGQERYRQIMTKVDELRGTPQVQQATETITTKASDMADTVKGKANDTVDKVTAKSVDLTDKTPMEGAAPSGSTF